MFFVKMLVLPRCEVLVALLTKILSGCDIKPYRLIWEFAANILRLVKSFTFTLPWSWRRHVNLQGVISRSKGIFMLRLWKSLLVCAYVVVLQCSHVRNVLLWNQHRCLGFKLLRKAYMMCKASPFSALILFGVQWNLIQLP
jgi:hypothetical protein